MKYTFVVLIFIFSQTFDVIGQDLTNKKTITFLPKLDTEINGIGLGLAINSMKYNGSTLTTRINGLHLELLGIGLIVPITPSNPLYPDGVNEKKVKFKVDSLIELSKMELSYQINGLSLSLGGLADHSAQVNGLNISGVNTLTSKTNGIAFASLFNFNKILNGITIGLFNDNIQTKGLQLGAFNHSDKLKGFQIGLWNVNQKRKLPLINWAFKK